MPHVIAERDELLPQSAVSARVGLLRLAVGVIQGLALYLLYFAAKSNAWPATEPFLFAPLLLVFLIVPVLLISSLGHLSWRTVMAWMVVAVVVIASLGFYDVWRGDTSGMLFSNDDDQARVRLPSRLLFIFLVSGFFIAHSLLLSAEQDQRRIGRYATHFETSWKLIIQLIFSGAFVGVLWGVLWLGASLFMLVKLDFLKELLQKSWFAIPITTFGFTCAMHITDVRPAIVRGIRSLLLVLLSWILPITTLMVVGFLMTLPITGVQPLWATRSATAILLGVAAMLVILINSAFQNGEVSTSIARVVRFSARLAALTLLPIVAIAVYALGLRVDEYGWTTDRIIAAACLLVAGSYAFGYAWAAFQSTWMRTIAPTNVVSAYLILLVLLALFSPISDPARISVNHQLARLNAGTVAANDFDFEYLRFEGVRYGHEALERLKAEAQGTDAAAIREKAGRALALKHPNRPHQANASAGEIAANIRVWPKQGRLPESFATQEWNAYKQPWELPMCLRQAGANCDAFLTDMTGDGQSDILLLPAAGPMQGVILVENSDGSWSLFGKLPRELSACESFRQKMIAGEYQLKPARIKELEIGGQRFEVQKPSPNGTVKCPPM